MTSSQLYHLIICVAVYFSNDFTEREVVARVPYSPGLAVVEAAFGFRVVARSPCRS